MQKQRLGEHINYPEQETIGKHIPFSYMIDFSMSASFVTGTVDDVVIGLIGTLGRQTNIHINKPDNYR